MRSIRSSPIGGQPCQQGGPGSGGLQLGQTPVTSGELFLAGVFKIGKAGLHRTGFQRNEVGAIVAATCDGSAQPFYGDKSAITSGRIVHANHHSVRIDILGRLLIEAIRQQVLTPQAVNYVVQKVLLEFKQAGKEKDSSQRLVKLAQSIKKLEREIGNLVHLSPTVTSQLPSPINCVKKKRYWQT